MDFDDLELFLRIAQLENISAAARDLRITPAAASARLASFEKRLGTRLFHRTTRMVTLTVDGRDFLPHAEHLIDAAAAARASLGGKQASPRGTLRVAAPSSFARMHVVPGLSAFVSKHPDLRLDLRLSDRVVDLVEGAFDVAIRYADLGDSTFVARKLAPDRRVLVASPEYLRRSGTLHHPNDLDNHDCLVVGTLDSWSFKGNGRERIDKQVTPTLRIDDGTAVRDATCAGLGVSLMATWCAAEELRSGELVPVLSEYSLISTQTLWAVYPNSRELAPKVRVFIDWLVARFWPEPYWDEGLNVQSER